jgi:hypothetical protein
MGALGPKDTSCGWANRTKERPAGGYDKRHCPGVSPSEVEAVLRLHPSVTDAAVFGKPLQRGGEMVVAAIEGIVVGCAEIEPLGLR